MSHTPQEIRKMETRKKLLDAGITLFSANGYYKTNSKEIAKLAGVSIGSFYSYFEDKKILLKEILNYYIDQTMSLEENQDEKSLIKEMDYDLFVRNMILRHEFSEGFFQQVTLLANTDEEIEKIYSDYRSRLLKQIDTMLIQHRDDLSESEISAISIILYSATEGAIHKIKFHRENVEEEILIQQLIHLFKHYMIKTT